MHQINQRIRPLKFIFILLIILCLSGCAGYLSKLGNKRFGINLSSSSKYQEKLCESILNYIDQHARIEAFGPQVIGRINPNVIFYTRLHNDYNLDYLLLFDISHIQISEIEAPRKTQNNSPKNKVQYQCTLSLTYRIIDLAEWKIFQAGQSNGTALLTQDSNQTDTSSEDQEFLLINQAMYNAVSNSSLFMQ